MVIVNTQAGVLWTSSPPLPINGQNSIDFSFPVPPSGAYQVIAKLLDGSGNTVSEAASLFATQSLNGPVVLTMAAAGSITTSDRDAAMEAVVDTEVYGFTNYSSGGQWSYSQNGNVITATGPGTTLTITLGSPITTMVETITNYHDPTTGYTVSGILNWVENTALSSFTYTGDFTLSGGIVSIVDVNVSITYGSYSGTITVDGQPFIY
jgi:hypothetical protein